MAFVALFPRIWRTLKRLRCPLDSRSAAQSLPCSFQEKAFEQAFLRSLIFQKCSLAPVTLGVALCDAASIRLLSPFPLARRPDPTIADDDRRIAAQVLTALAALLVAIVLALCISGCGGDSSTWRGIDSGYESGSQPAAHAGNELASPD